MRLRRLAVGRPIGAGIERDPCFLGGAHELSHIDRVGEFEPQEDPAFRPPHLDRGAEFALDGLDHRREFVAQHGLQFAQMGRKGRTEIFGRGHLVESAGAAVRLALQGDEPRKNFGARDHIAEPQGGREGLREGTDMHDGARIERIESGRRLLEGEVGVAFVLEDEHARLAGERK